MSMFFGGDEEELSREWAKDEAVNDTYTIIGNYFDSSENHSPKYSRNLGIILGNRQAEMTVNELNKKFGAQFKGYDGEMYPFYTFLKLEKFNIYSLDRGYPKM